MSIREIQDEIIEEFELLSDDREATLYYLMELGDKMSPLADGYKTNNNLIKGCQSSVWLHTDFKDNKVIFIADSNTDITRGLISLLVRVYSGQSADDIINTDLDFIEKIGMSQVIGSQRSNGFAAMIKQMKLYALGYKTKAGLN
ncbi:MAG: SufE family protein [Bacteroidota bacterium]